MAGLNSANGSVMSDMDHIAQSIGFIISTALGERVMREWFGTPGNAILGQNMTQPQIMRWWSVIWAALTIFEPRFVPKRLVVDRASKDGSLEITMLGEFKPYAHLNFEQASFFISVTSSGVTVRRAT